VVSNGHRVSRKVRGSWTTWHWRMAEPMTTYLAFFAAGRFRTESGTRFGLPYTYAVSRRLGPVKQRRAMTMLRRTPKVVRWLESEYGKYPFESTGGLVTGLNIGFALENQTRPVYFYTGAGPSATSLVVHEIAHQWFGNSVSVEKWRDIWLNEGFATFAEWKYAEEHGGPRAQHRLVRIHDRLDRRDGFWALRIGSPGPRWIFDWPVYDRGAMTLQALRHRIGDRDFDVLLRTWLRQHADSNASIADFTGLAERVSGEQLEGFFRAWLYTDRKPRKTAANGLR